MNGTFDKRLLHQFDRRDNAVNALKETCSDVGDTVKSEVKQLTDGTTIEEMIIAHPFIAAGVALGAGVLVSKLLTGGGSSSGSSGGEPQRVVIEVKHTAGEGTVSAAAPAAAGFNPVEFVMKAVAGYEAVQNLWRTYQQNQAASHHQEPVGPIEPDGEHV
ncbi:MAG: hypothetical protein WCT04_20395 [Planctomycetota bacterium]